MAAEDERGSAPQGHGGSRRKHTNTLSLRSTWLKRHKDRSSYRTQIEDVLYVSPPRRGAGGQAQRSASTQGSNSPGRRAPGPCPIQRPVTIKKRFFSINPQHPLSVFLYLVVVIKATYRSHTPQHLIYYVGWRRQTLRRSAGNTSAGESTWNHSDASPDNPTRGLCHTDLWSRDGFL